MDNPYIEIIKTISIENKYTNWYCSIIRHCLSRINHIDKKDKKEYAKNLLGYVESHHILPVSLCSTDGQIKDSINRVLLSAREHFIVHWILKKMFVDKFRHKMVMAFSKMRQNRTGNRYYNSLSYERQRKDFSMIVSAYSKDTVTCLDIESGKSFRISIDEFKSNDNLIGIATGYRHSIEQKQKWAKERMGSGNPRYGVEWTNEQKDKSSGKNHHSYGVEWGGTEEQRKLISDRTLGKVVCKNTITKKTCVVSKEEFDLNDYLIGASSGRILSDEERKNISIRNVGMMTCLNTQTGKHVRVSVEDYNKHDYLISTTKGRVLSEEHKKKTSDTMTGMVVCKNKYTGERFHVTKIEFDSNPDLVGHTYCIK